MRCVSRRYAAACETDQHFRPTAGHINFNEHYLADVNTSLLVAVTTHELIHALGFSSSLFKKFHNPVRPERTRRSPAATCPEGSRHPASLGAAIGSLAQEPAPPVRVHCRALADR